jgi:hypothetical protein
LQQAECDEQESERADPQIRDAVGPAWHEAASALFAPVREGAIESGAVEDAINVVIDEAGAEVRAGRWLDASR